MATSKNRRPGKGKGLTRSLVRSFAATGKTKPAEGNQPRASEPSACERCGAVFARRVWRRREQVSHDLLARARWVVCPACRQVDAEEYMGRVLLRGPVVATDEALLQRRIANVAERGRSTQPERRLVSIERRGDLLEVLTTSQKLAHRIVHEVKKLFGGTATYAWSDDRSLLATWKAPARRVGTRRAVR